MRITKVNDVGIKLISDFEGIKLKAYKCSAGVWTIGIGSTYYENGTRVKEGDIISLERAYSLFAITLISYEKAVDSFTRDDITQNQFNALVSFAYNLGNNALKGSTLLKKVNINPNDLSIILEFNKWTKAAGKVVSGLVRRRKTEGELYFKK